jgi:hypothetical protein
MILDKETQLSAAQAITASAASTNIYDFGATPDSGFGTSLKLQCNIDTTFTTLTHLNFIGQTAASAADLNNSPTNIFDTSVALIANTQHPLGLSAGATILLPAIAGNLQRFFRLKYVPGGANAGAGALTTTLAVIDTQNNVPTTDFR